MELTGVKHIKFDPERVKNECKTWIKEWFDRNGENCNAIVGISGGKDSSVVAALCVEALGKDRVIGVLMPNHIQDDITYSHMLCEHLGIKNYTVDVGVAIDNLLNTIYDRVTDIDLSEQTRINLPARMRMVALYAISQSMNGRVANTCNLSEDWVGYSTRYGDAAGDFSPLSQLTSDEVIQIGQALGLPEELMSKPPSDGLCGKTDEDNLGFTYEILNKYIHTGICDDKKVKAKIDILHEKNLFKLQPMPCFEFRF